MRATTPAQLAHNAGYKTLDPRAGTFFKSVTGYHDGTPVGLILRVRRSRLPGEYVFSVATDGDAVIIQGRGSSFELEAAEISAMIAHEVHVFRKEAS